jgi:hypothetical protein
MTTTAIIGQPGTGKTLYLTMIGNMDYIAGKRIVSNYSLSFEHRKVDIYELLQIIDDVQDNIPTTVLIQEASKWFDARRSMRIENSVLSSLTGQQRKRDMDIYYDDQFITRIDAGLRDITNYSFISNAKFMPDGKTPFMFEYEQYYGYFRAATNKTMRFPASFMEQFYRMYNTKEITAPLVK